MRAVRSVTINWQRISRECTDALVAACFLSRTNDQYGASIPIQAAVVELPYRGLGDSCQLIVAKPIACCRSQPVTVHARPFEALGLGFFDADQISSSACCFGPRALPGKHARERHGLRYHHHGFLGLIMGWTAMLRRSWAGARLRCSGIYADLFFTPEDRIADIPSQEMAIARQMGNAAGERWYIRKDGSRFWADGCLMPLWTELAISGSCATDRAARAAIRPPR